MSNENIVFAYIREAFPSYRKDDQQMFQRCNDAALNDWPVADTWPPLVRGMLSVTGEGDLGGSFRGHRLISIVGTFNGIEVRGMIQWLEKFEALLRRVYWIEAEVYSLGGWEGGRCRFLYRVPMETIIAYSGESPMLPTTWKLRCLELPSISKAAEPPFIEALRQRPEFTSDPPD